MTMGITRTLSFYLAAILLVTCAPTGWDTAFAQERSTTGRLSYYYYFQQYSDAIYPERELIVDLAGYTANTPKAAFPYLDREGSPAGLWVGEECELLTVKVDVPQTGLYSIELTYFPFANNDMQIMFGLLIDGALPFTEANSCVVTRVYQNGPIRQDEDGNDIRPRAIQTPACRRHFLSDQTGIFGCLAFYLEEGAHELTFCFEESDMLIESIILKQEPFRMTYQDYATMYNQLGAKDAQGVLEIVQAETYYQQSSSTLWPDTDRSNPLTQPFDYHLTKINFGGGGQWKQPGQSISWKIVAPVTGFYNLGIKYRQGYLDGLFASRKIMIDGQTHFQELNSVRFNYTTQWENMVLGNNHGPYSIYLTEGEHILTMENVLGDLNQTMSVMQTCINNLNALYLSIIMITGNEPDKYRNYYLEKQLPDLPAKLRENADMLFAEARQLIEVVGAKGRETAYFEDIGYNLISYSENIGDLTYKNRLVNLKNDISSLSAKLVTYQEQALDIDFFVLTSPGEDMPRSQPTVGETVSYQVESFAASFENEEEDINASIRVWVSGGNKQFEVLKQMIEDIFTPQTGIEVDLELVTGSLIQAFVASVGPDIQLGVGGDSVANMGIRGALEPLDEYPGYEELIAEYFDGCDIPFTLEERIYGIPNTGGFGMMFVRMDVFEQLGLAVPSTWDEVYDIAQVLQRNNMSLGIVPSFTTLLYQNGGSYYDESLTRVMFDEEVAVDAFRQQTDFYTQYDFPLAFDFISRFRTGEMPIALTSYGTYNTLKYSAPEIGGLWKMYPIPGTVREDGSVDYTQAPEGVSGVVMLKNAKNKDAAWEFINWWSGSEAQTRYGKDIEAAIGITARYTTLNTKVFSEIGWTRKELEVLNEGIAHLRFTPIVPGDYYVGRGINNTFRAVVYDGENVREKLREWTTKINNELTRKRKEFYANNESNGGAQQ